MFHTDLYQEVQVGHLGEHFEEEDRQERDDVVLCGLYRVSLEHWLLRVRLGSYMNHSFVLVAPLQATATATHTIGAKQLVVAKKGPVF